MKNVKEITVEIKSEEWETILDRAFNKIKKDIKVDGFRKGSVTKSVYIKKVGVEGLYNEASEIAINDHYKEVMDSVKEDIAVEPSISIESIKPDGAVFKFKIITRPEVKLGDYKKLGIKKEKVTVSKEEIEHEISHLVEHMAEVVIKENGSVVKGDTAVIDFEGFVDGKPLEGGSGKNYPLEIGGNAFIPGFEDGLVGMKVNEEKELNLKFPEDYTPELKGKDVVFKVKINEIKEHIVPEMDKDFFEDLGIEGVDSKDKLEEHVKKEIEERKEHEADEKYTDELLRKACDNMKVEINDEIVEAEVNRMLEQLNEQLSMQGLNVEQYLSFMGKNVNDLRAESTPQAIARIKTRYLLEEVIKAEKIKATDKEIEENIKKVSEMYGMSEEEILKSVGNKDMFAYDVEMHKAIDIIKEG